MPNIKRDIATIFFSQIRIIIITSIIVTISAVLIAFFWPPTFSSSAKILVKGKKVEKSHSALEKIEPRFFQLTPSDLFSEIELIKSKSVLENTVKKLKDSDLYTFKHDFTRSKLKKSIKARVLPASNVIKIVFSGDDPKEAAIILKTLLENYLVARADFDNPASAAQFFTNQTSKFKDTLADKGVELLMIMEGTNSVDPKREIENNIILKRELQVSLNSLKNQSIEKKLFIDHLLETLDKEKVQLFSFIQDNISITHISDKLQQVVIERGDIARHYHLKSEKVVSVDRQINDLFSTLKSEVVAYKDNLYSQLQIINKKIMTLVSKIDSIDKMNLRLQKQLIETETIMRETDILKSSYETFARRREEAKIGRSKSKTDSLSYISILARPSIASEPDFPNKRIVIPMGIFFGFVAGCSLAFFRDSFNNTFRGLREVEKFGELPLLMSIQNYENDKKRWDIL